MAQRAPNRASSSLTIYFICCWLGTRRAAPARHSEPTARTSAVCNSVSSRACTLNCSTMDLEKLDATHWCHVVCTIMNARNIIEDQPFSSLFLDEAIKDGQPTAELQLNEQWPPIPYYMGRWWSWSNNNVIIIKPPKRASSNQRLELIIHTHVPDFNELALTSVKDDWGPDLIRKNKMIEQSLWSL